MEQNKITIDDVEYDLENASEEAKAQLANIQFVNELILQKNNELNIAMTAKIGYSRSLQRELEKIGDEWDLWAWRWAVLVGRCIG